MDLTILIKKKQLKQKKLLNMSTNNDGLVKHCFVLLPFINIIINLKEKSCFRWLTLCTMNLGFSRQKDKIILYSIVSYFFTKFIRKDFFIEI